MNFINYLREGVDTQNGVFNRFNTDYPENKVEIIGATNQYSKMCTPGEPTRNASTYFLGNAVKITTVKPDLNNKCSAFWNDRGSESYLLGLSGIGIGIIGCIGATLTIINRNNFPFSKAIFVATSLTSCILAISGTALSILGFHRKNQANAQYDAWKCPVNGLAHQRGTAGEKGFTYVFSQKLKGFLIHPDECHTLWEKYYKTFMAKYAGIDLGRPNNTQEVKEFFNNNPLNSKVIAYAFDESSTQDPKPDYIARSYSQLETSYRNICNEANSVRQKIWTIEHQLIAENENQRECWIKPLRLYRDLMIQEADDNRQNAIQPFQDECDRIIGEINANHALDSITKQHQITCTKNDYKDNQTVRKAKQTYEQKRRKYELLYTIATTPINMSFDNQNKKNSEWATNQINHINNVENKNIDYYCGKHINSLARQALAYLNRLSEAEHPVENSLYPSLFSNIEAAPISLANEPPSYNPENYANVECDQNDLKDFFNRALHLN